MITNPFCNAASLKKYGPWVVVTGASSGIGRAIADRLAAAGLHLVLAARSERELAVLADEWKVRSNIECRVVLVDFSDPAGVDALLAATHDLDIGLLVAAAGFGTAGEFLRGNLDEELGMLEVNCRTVLRLSHHFGNQFAARAVGGGMILFGSLVGYQGTPRAAAYAATKAYIQTLGEALHVELKSRKVDVLVCAPGPVRSGFAARSRMKLGLADNPETVAEETLRALGRRMTVTPGPVSKLLTGSLKTAPRFVRVRLMGKIMGGMTAHLD